MGTNMPRWQLLLTFVAAVVVTAVVVRLIDRRAETAVEREHRSSEQELAARLDALEARERFSTLRGERGSRLWVPAPAVAASAADRADKVAPPAEAPRRPGTRDVKAAAMLEDKFQAEPVNRPWAQAAEREYRGIIDAHLPQNSRVVSLECRSDFCRLEVVHESIESSNDFLMRLFSMKEGRAMGTSAGGFRAAQPTPEPDGKLDYVVYIARPGVSVALDAVPDPHPVDQP
jgi:hypothetical protein